MTDSVKTQIRGNCQCCGRDQAVLPSGRMAKHGYQVKNGWFEGTCTGHLFSPMQKYRTQTDSLVVSVRSQVKDLLQLAADLQAGKVIPKTCRVDHRPNSEQVPFKDAPEWAQKAAINAARFLAESRARLGESFANDMEALVNRVHGQELKVVPIEAGPPPVQVGEHRMLRGKVVTSYRVDGGKVYAESSDRKFCLTTRAWRLLQSAE